MKVKFVHDSELPGAFVIESETPDEAVIIRHFTNWQHTIQEPLRLFMGNSGGTSTSASFLVHWRKEADFQNPPSREGE